MSDTTFTWILVLTHFATLLVFGVGGFVLGRRLFLDDVNADLHFWKTFGAQRGIEASNAEHARCKANNNAAIHEKRAAYFEQKLNEARGCKHIKLKVRTPYG